MRRTLGVAIASVVALMAPAVAHAAPEPWRSGQPVFSPPASTPSIVGANYHGAWDDMTPARRSAVLDQLAAAGVRWVRLDIAWRTLQPSSPTAYDAYGTRWIDTLVNEIHARGMKTLMMLYWAPRWSSGTDNKNGVPRSAREYAAAAAYVADRWRGKVGAIEVWNEPDLDRFLANTSVSTFTALVKAAYLAVKAVNPGMVVVAGAPTYVGTSWYQGFFANGGADHYDALGIHPYIGMADAPPETCDPSWVQYYPCDIANLVSLMQRYGDGDKKLWATEYGWSSHPTTSYGSRPPNWKRGVSEQRQAEYLLRMQAVLARWPQVQASFWYTDVNTAVGDAQEDNYGLLRRDLARKPVFYALRCAAADICGPAAPTALAPPGSLSATASGPEVVDLRWAAATGADSYRVLREGQQVARVTGTTFRDSGLSPSRRYTYQVIAVHGMRGSAASTSVSVRTPFADPLVTRGSTWRFNDSGRDLRRAWRLVGYDASGWRSGPAELGYGDGDEVTEIGHGENARQKHMTTYARLRFDGMQRPVPALRLRYLVDDGAVFYLNGQRIHAHNVPTQAVTATTPALACVGGIDETRRHAVRLPASALRRGVNVLAVEVHQCGPESSDLSFDASLRPVR